MWPDFVWNSFELTVQEKIGGLTHSFLDEDLKSARRFVLSL